MAHIHEGLRAAFLSIPYTKSTSTRKWLERDYGFSQIGYQHSTDAPEGFFTWTVVRDPRERAVSLWRRIQRAPERELLRRCHFGERPIPSDFTAWMRVLVEEQPIGYRVNGDADLGARQFWSQAEILAGVSPDRIFRFEDVPAAYVRLPFVDVVRRFPHHSENRMLRHLIWDHVATEETERLVGEWAGEDFAFYEEAGS